MRHVEANVIEIPKSKPIMDNIKDEVLQIIGVKKNSNCGLIFKVEWKERPDGTKPPDSVVDNRFLRKFYPLLLIGFYEERIITVRMAKELKKNFSKAKI